MNKSDSITNLAVALAKFQGEVKNPANSAVNPHFKSKYAPLHEILNSVRPILAKYGLSVMQFPSGDGENIIVSSILLHESGEWIEACPLTLKADKVTAQGAGSAITYGRRYSLAALLGISSEDDDDGNEAEKQSNGKPPSRPQAPPAGQSQSKPAQNGGDKVSEAQLRAIYAIGKKANVDEDYIKARFGLESMKDLTKKQASEIIEEMQKAAG